MRSASRSGTLPGLNRRNRKQVTAEDVTEMKLLIQKMEIEKRQIKAKTSRMKQTIIDRNKAIDNVFKENTEKQTIKTASENQLEKLRESIRSLENTLSARKEELLKIKNGDRIAVSDEMKEEVKVMYLEHKRLLKQSKAVKEGENIVHTELTRVTTEVNEKKLNNQAILSLQNDLSSIVDKVVSYKKSELKLQNDEIARFLSANPKQANTKEEEINEEINNIKKDIEDINNQIKEQEDKEDEMIKSLQKVIEQQSAKIHEQVARIHGQEVTEEEEKQEEQSEVIINDENQNLSESSIHETEEEEKEEKKPVLVLGKKEKKSDTFMTNDGTPMRTVEME